MANGTDILEDYILGLSPGLINTLLEDHALSTGNKQHNIFWKSVFSIKKAFAF